MAHQSHHHTNYFLTCDEYDELLGRSDRCHRCQTRPHEVLDHDHRIGHSAVRGLVCRPCNRRLGEVDAGRIPMDDADSAYLAKAWHLQTADRVIGKGPTRVRPFRVKDDLWDSAKAEAAKRGETVTAVLIRALRRYVGDQVDGPADQ